MGLSDDALDDANALDALDDANGALDPEGKKNNEPGQWIIT